MREIPSSSFGGPRTPRDDAWCDMKKFDRRKFVRKKPKPGQHWGLVLYFYGNGKGKTSAAIGTAVRASGAGMRVVVVQFMKSEKWKSYERQALKKLGIPVHVLGSGFVGIIDDKHPLSWHKKTAKAALKKLKSILTSGTVDLVVADELVSAVEEGLLTERDTLLAIRVKPENVHLVITGHSRYPKLVAASDIVSEIRNIKHPYYTEGMTAQRGVDF